jgi:hypothetical protein
MMGRSRQAKCTIALAVVGWRLSGNYSGNHRHLKLRSSNNPAIGDIRFVAETCNIGHLYFGCIGWPVAPCNEATLCSA